MLVLLDKMLFGLGGWRLGMVRVKFTGCIRGAEGFGLIIFGDMSWDVSGLDLLWARFMAVNPGMVEQGIWYQEHIQPVSLKASELDRHLLE